MGNSFLQPAWGKSSKNVRFNQLRHYFEGKNILDVGCVVGYKKTDWMHENIKRVAGSVYGIDLDDAGVKILQTKGYAVETGNAQSFDLNKKFDLVHAGELIEHLDNPGSFLDSARKHLNENGRLLMTTPNGLRVSNFIYASTGGLLVNGEHTCWFCEYTMKSLLERKGFEVERIGYLKHESVGFFRKLLLKIRSWILPDRVAWNTLYVIAKAKKAG
jgi:2-polyprenyl-3-methyl-5-hydroxy-6-metoxy-1,4-benzoquinol methylase